MPAGPKPVTCDPSTENDDKSGLLPTALVTGGAVRVGRILALALAELGFAVAIHCNRATEAAEALAGTIEQEGGRAVVVKGDLAEPGTAAAVVAAAVQGLGEPLGMLVNNAALFVAVRCRPSILRPCAGSSPSISRPRPCSPNPMWRNCRRPPPASSSTSRTSASPTRRPIT